MICETCHGTGTYPRYIPCIECNGSGIAHCCDGLQEQACIYCAAGDHPIKMKRQYIHRLGYRNVLCGSSWTPSV